MEHPIDKILEVLAALPDDSPTRDELVLYARSKIDGLFETALGEMELVETDAGIDLTAEARNQLRNYAMNKWYLG